MSQSEYMKEAERLLDEVYRFKWAEGVHDIDGAFQSADTCGNGANKARAALLAHIQRGNHSYTVEDIPPRIWDDEKKQYKYLKVPVTSEVPMPEPKPDRVTQIGHGPRIYSHSPQQFKKWGESCQAAGYARAANWLRAKAEKHAEENGYHEPDTGSFVFASREAEEWNNSVLELADEMEAALRREVKP